jgi:hypothetical protein
VIDYAQANSKACIIRSLPKHSGELSRKVVMYENSLVYDVEWVYFYDSLAKSSQTISRHRDPLA